MDDVLSLTDHLTSFQNFATFSERHLGAGTQASPEVDWEQSEIFLDTDQLDMNMRCNRAVFKMTAKEEKANHIRHIRHIVNGSCNY